MTQQQSQLPDHCPHCGAMRNSIGQLHHFAGCGQWASPDPQMEIRSSATVTTIKVPPIEEHHPACVSPRCDGHCARDPERAAGIGVCVACGIPLSGTDFKSIARFGTRAVHRDCARSRATALQGLADDWRKAAERA